MKYKGKYALRLILTLIFLSCSFVAVSYMISFINLKNVESNLYIKLDEASYQIKEELNIKKSSLVTLGAIYDKDPDYENLCEYYISQGLFSHIELVSSFDAPLEDNALYVKINDSVSIKGEFRFPEYSLDFGKIYIYDDNKKVLNGEGNIDEFLNNAKKIHVLPFTSFNVIGQFFEIDDNYYVYKSLDSELKINAMYVIDTQTANKEFNSDLSRIKLITSLLEIAIFLIMLIIWYRMIKHDLFIADLKNKDELTGIYKLNKFKTILNKRLNNPKYNYTVYCFDISKFRFINEAHGRDFGDLLLQNIVSAIRKSQSRKTIFARGNNDIFYLAINDVKPDDIQKIYNNLVNDINNLYIDSGLTVILDCGVYIVNDDKDVEAIIDKADITRKIYKNDELTHFAIFDEKLNSNVKRRNELESWAKEALKNNEFIPYFQPKGEIVKSGLSYYGSEALVRWLHDGKMISPGEFIPLFEENGFIVEFDFYMFRRIVEIMATWKRMGFDHKIISINFSRRHLSNPNFVKRLNEIVDTYKVSTKDIEIEILEGLDVDDYYIFSDLCTKLKKSGYRIAIDDFGSGYSSLNALRNIKADVVKIDKGFFLEEKKKRRTTVDKEKDTNILKGIVQIIADSKMSLVFEGVENEEILNRLRDMISSYKRHNPKTEATFAIQGYYFAKPLSQSEWEDRFIVKSNFKSDVTVKPVKKKVVKEVKNDGDTKPE